MLNDLWQLVVQFAEFLWPFRIISQWERALYLVNGRVVIPWRWVAFRWQALDSQELPPGLYLVFPFFATIHQVAIAWDYVDSGRLDLTLKTGEALSCEAVAKMRVVDLYKAYVGFHDYEIDRRAMLKAAISETLVEADAERFESGKRGRLLGSSLLKAVRDGASDLGHEVESVQVTTFVLKPKVFRLLQ